MISLDSIFRNHAVLQCGKPVALTGTAPALSELKAVLDGECYIAHTGQDGRFYVPLGSHPAGGPFHVSISSGEEELVLEDVLFGDVWIAGGQSNMEMKLEDCDLSEITDEPFLSDIRYYNTAEGAPEGWVCCDEDSRLKMSAAAYHFACRVREKAGHPVGIIEGCIGGTSIASWIPEEILKKSDVGRPYIEDFNKQIEGVTERQYRDDLASFKLRADAWNEDTKSYRRKHPDKSWAEVLEVFGTAPWPEPIWYDSPFCPGYPYRTMIEPVTVCPAKGFIFYQGEADAWNYRNYPELMRMLIGEWRRAWKDETLPFLFVQLPMFRFSASPEDFNWANQRLAQKKAAETVPNTYMAVMTDQGELDNIHPVSKRPAGERLARLALRYVYGIPVEADAPKAGEIVLEDGLIRIEFENTGGALRCDGDEVKAFEVSFDGECFRPASGSVDGNYVLLHAADGRREKTESGVFSVRYAFASFCETNLYGVNGLPAMPFSAVIQV